MSDWSPIITVSLTSRVDVKELNLEGVRRSGVAAENELNLWVCLRGEAEEVAEERMSDMLEAELLLDGARLFGVVGIDRK